MFGNNQKTLILHIVSIKCVVTDKTFFVCETLEGHSLYVFENQLAHVTWRNSGYSDDIQLLQKDEILRCHTTPIEVYAYQNNGYWNVETVIERSKAHLYDESIDVPTEYPSNDRSNYYDHIYTIIVQLLESNYVAIFDTETSGLDMLTSEIVTIAASNFSHSLFDPETVYIKPQYPHLLLDKGKNGKSPHDIHGIGPDDLEGCPTFPEVYPMLRDKLSHNHWVVYNANYDVTLLDNLCGRHGLSIIPRRSVTCAMELLAPLFGKWGGQRYLPLSLSNTTKKLIPDYNTDNAHDAYADVWMTRNILQAAYKYIDGINYHA